MKVSLLFPIGVVIAGTTSKVWIRLLEWPTTTSPPSVKYHWRQEQSQLPYDHRADVLADWAQPGPDLELEIVGPRASGTYLLEISASNGEGLLAVPVQVIARDDVPSHLVTGLTPLSFSWGVDRGLPVHRLHLEQFLEKHSADIKGRCLEFQEPRYVPQFGGAAVRTLDVLHADHTNSRATLVADISGPNSLVDSSFDCIVCSHVLQSVFLLERAIRELHRILAPGGVLLVAEPQVSMCDPRYGECWRFTAEGLMRLVLTAFLPGDVVVESYGNSLTAAGELRGLIAADYPTEVLGQHDPRFAAEVCARAVKR